MAVDQEGTGVPGGSERVRFLFSLMLLLVCACPCIADDRLPIGFRAFPQDGWVFAARGAKVRPIQSRIVRLVDEELARIRQLLGGKSRQPYHVLYCSGRSEFKSVTVELGGKEPSEWVVALAFPARGIMLLDGSRRGPAVSDRETISHELVHLVLGDAGYPIPRWYHEGLAQWVSGRIVKPKEFSDVAGLAAREMLPSFVTLDQFMSETHVQSSLLYTQSHLFVAHLSHLHGSSVHRGILAESGKHGFTRAFQSVVGERLEVVEQGFAAELRSRFSLYQWLWYNIGIFPALAVLLVFGYFFQRRLRIKKLARMAREEQLEDALLAAEETEREGSP